MRHLLSLALLLTCAAAAATEPPGKTDPGVVSLPRYEVRERKGVSDFGMSVVTNLGVIWGGKIKWMRVGTVLPGSSAALAGLNPHDEILAIDQVAVAELRRKAMLEKFFARSPGSRVTLLVRASPTRLLRQLDLKTNPLPPR